MYSNEDFLGSQCNATRLDVRKVQNEIAFANLFQAASNPRIYELLTVEERKQLSEILAAYTALNIRSISRLETDDAYNIRMYNKYKN